MRIRELRKKHWKSKRSQHVADHPYSDEIAQRATWILVSHCKKVLGTTDNLPPAADHSAPEKTKLSALLHLSSADSCTFTSLGDISAEGKEGDWPQAALQAAQGCFPLFGEWHWLNLCATMNTPESPRRHRWWHPARLVYLASRFPQFCCLISLFGLFSNG